MREMKRTPDCSYLKCTLAIETAVHQNLCRVIPGHARFVSFSWVKESGRTRRYECCNTCLLYFIRSTSTLPRYGMCNGF